MAIARPVNPQWMQRAYMRYDWGVHRVCMGHVRDVQGMCVGRTRAVYWGMHMACIDCQGEMSSEKFK